MEWGLEGGRRKSYMQGLEERKRKGDTVRREKGGRMAGIVGRKKDGSVGRKEEGGRMVGSGGRKEDEW